MSDHTLTWRHNGPADTARCSCGAVLRAADLPHVDLDTMLDYLDARGIPKETTGRSNERAA